MSSPDEFDLDDGIFDDAQTLAALEASALKSSQAPKRHIAPYRHVVAPPKPGPSRPSAAPVPAPKPKFGGRNDPGTINTEPRAGGSGFGWEHGGKRSMDGNVERYLAQVNDRQAYWQHGNQGANDGEEESYPDVTINKDGGYGIDVGEVVDTHSRPTNPVTAPPVRTEEHRKEDEAKRAQAAAARRAAINQASQQFAVPGPGPSTARTFAKTTSVPLQQDRPLPAAGFAPNARTLSRSTSAGHHPVSRPFSRGPISHLPPIPSQSSSQNGSVPSTQGALARKTAVELEEERSKREAVEAELRRVKAEMARQQKEYEARREREEMEVDLRDAGQAKAAAVDDGAQAELQERFKLLQSEFYRAKGEAESMRRAQKDEHARHLAEAEKLRSKIDDMELKLKERDKEAARALDNIKTQAVFANHAAHSSAFKNRAASQRPGATPMRNGSPRSKINEESFLQRTSLKGKGKAVAEPRFPALQNGFAISPTASRVKRPRVESVAPEYQLGSPSRSKSAAASPIRARTPTRRAEPLGPSPAPMMGDVDMGEIGGEDLIAGPDEGSDVPKTLRSELLHHFFSYVPYSPFQAACDPNSRTQTALYRILNYRPRDDDDRRTFARQSNDLLYVCGEPEIHMGAVVEIMATWLFTLKENCCNPLALADLVALLNVLALMSKTAWRFPDCRKGMSRHRLHDGQDEVFALKLQLFGIVKFFYSDLKTRDMLDAKFAAELERESEELRLANEGMILPAQAAGTQTGAQRQTQLATQGRAAEEAEAPAKAAPTLTEAQRGWYEELAFRLADVIEAMCWGSEDYTWAGDQLADITMTLTNPALPPSIVERCSGIVWTAAAFPKMFDSLMIPSHKWPGDSPVLERVCKLLINVPVDMTESQMLKMTFTLLRALSALSIARKDATVLIGQRSLVIVALITVLRRFSSRLWGICPDDLDLTANFDVVSLGVTLFHHLLFPHFTWSALQRIYPRRDPYDDYDDPEPEPYMELPVREPVLDDPDKMQGVDLIARLKDPKVLKDYHGIGHQFISAFGALAFGDPSFDTDNIADFDLDGVQSMAADILAEVVEGPEEDAVYELYADVEESDDDDEDEEEMDVDMADGRKAPGEEVDQEAYHEVIEIDDDSE